MRGEANGPGLMRGSEDDDFFDDRDGTQIMYILSSGQQDIDTI